MVAIFRIIDFALGITRRGAVLSCPVADPTPPTPPPPTWAPIYIPEEEYTETVDTHIRPWGRPGIFIVNQPMQVSSDEIFMHRRSFHKI